MAIEWNTTATNMEKAVGGVLGKTWSNVSVGASAQLSAVAAAGRAIEQGKDTMTQADYDNLKLMQQRALEGVLQAYQGISLVVAEQAASAAWGVVAAALKTAYPALVFL